MTLKQIFKHFNITEATTRYRVGNIGPNGESGIQYELDIYNVVLLNTCKTRNYELKYYNTFNYGPYDVETEIYSL